MVQPMSDLLHNRSARRQLTEVVGVERVS